MIKMRNSILLCLLILFMGSCVKTNESPISDGLKLIGTYELGIPQPSGLSRSHMDGSLYTISNQTGSMYLINITGNVSQTHTIDGNDLEGIEYVTKTNSIYMLEESQRKVIRTAQNGTRLGSFDLAIPVTDENDGPEGITYNPAADHFYIVNEKNPSRLYIYDINFNAIANYPLSFAKDYSSIDFDPVEGKLWILSDQSGTLTRCNLTGSPEKTYRTNVPKGEGVVVDMNSKTVYIVCDATSKLYVFTLEK